MRKRLGFDASFRDDIGLWGRKLLPRWMKNPRSAMISCNDGFRPVSFYIETIEE